MTEQHNGDNIPISPDIDSTETPSAVNIAREIPMIVTFEHGARMGRSLVRGLIVRQEWVESLPVKKAP